MTRSKTKILVDGGDPQETRQVEELLGLVDGQTTNPSLIAKNPHIEELITSGHKLSNREEMDEYKKIVQTISPLVGDAGVSIEVFSDEESPKRVMRLLAEALGLAPGRFQVNRQLLGPPLDGSELPPQQRPTRASAMTIPSVVIDDHRSLSS